MKKQKVVRSFGPTGRGKEENLRKALEDGWIFVRASEYIEGGGGYAGFIEYILEKDEDSKEEEKLREELEALREKLNRVRAEKENVIAIKELLERSNEAKRKDTLKALVKPTEMERFTAERHEALYIDAEKLHAWGMDIKSILKKTISATEEEISEAEEEGGTEC